MMAKLKLCSGRTLWTVAVVLLTFGCLEPEPAAHNDVVVFFDLTEYQERGTPATGLAEPSKVDGVINLFAGTDDEYKDGGTFTLYNLSDSRLLGDRKFVELEVGDWNQSNRNRRRVLEAARAAAREAINESIQDAGDNTSDEVLNQYKTTSIIEPLCEYLRNVKAPSRPATTRYLIFFSDLLENSSAYSFYGSSTFNDSGAKVADVFIDVCGLQGTLPEMVYIIENMGADQGDEYTNNLLVRSNDAWIAFFTELGFVQRLNL